MDRLVPKQHSSGGKDRLGSISKQGDRYLRSLFVAGALSVIRYAKITAPSTALAHGLLARRPTKVAAVALANKPANGLGDDGQGRALQESRRTGGNEITPGNWRDVKVGRANARNAEPVDPAIRTTHLCQRISNACF